MKPNPETVLDEKTILQLSWKPSIVRNIALTIVKHFPKDRIAYTDEVNLAFVLDTGI